GWALFRVRDLRRQVIDVEAELTYVLGLEGSELEVNRYEAPQSPVDQEQVNIVMPVARRDSELPGDKTEVSTRACQARRTPITGIQANLRRPRPYGDKFYRLLRRSRCDGKTIHTGIGETR